MAADDDRLAAAALWRPELLAIAPAKQGGYRAALANGRGAADLPFVEFF